MDCYDLEIMLILKYDYGFDTSSVPQMIEWDYQNSKSQLSDTNWQGSHESTFSGCHW
jgi:hypothetical protein